MSSIYKLFPIIFLILLDLVFSLNVNDKSEGKLLPDMLQDVLEERQREMERQLSSDDITKLMMKYLKDNKANYRDSCKYESEECHKFVDMFAKRCSEGDCYTLDNIQLVKFPDGLEVSVPSLNQYAFARSVFEKSRAWVKVNFYDVFKRLKYYYGTPNKRSLEAFNKNIIRKNLPNMKFEDSDRTILTEFLYHSTLHFSTYVFENPMSSPTNKHSFFRFFFRIKERSWLIKKARNISKHKTLKVTMPKLKSLIDSYLLYLNTSGVIQHYRLSISYTKLVKHALIKLVGEKRVDYLMSDFMLKEPLELKNFCSGSSPSNCSEMVTEYADRCEEGDCTTLNYQMLLDGKDSLNVKLPQLNQLDVSFHLFINSRAHKSWFTDFILRRKNTLSQSQFMDKLYEKNTEKVDYNGTSHRVLSKYLYYDSLYFHRRSLMGRFVKFFSKSTNKTLKAFLNSLITGNHVSINKNKLNSMFVAFRNYLFASKFSKNKDKVIDYVQKCHDIFLEFMDGTHLVKKEKKDNNKLLEENLKESKREDSLFDWEKVDLNMYENMKNQEEEEDEVEEENPSTSRLLYEQLLNLR